jgi:CRP/FNR family transcriptional regulator, cyclic AMP receptor protein
MTGPVTHSLVKALRGVRAFSSLDDDILLRIAGVSTNLFWPAGSVVFEEGSPSDALYVVLSGRVRIVDRDGERESEVAGVEPGDSFGELSLMLSTTHSKTAVVDEDAELMTIPKTSFRDLLESNPDLTAYFQKLVEGRTRVRGDVSDSE